MLSSLPAAPVALCPSFHHLNPTAEVEGQPLSLALQRGHAAVKVGAFCRAWAEGRAGVVPRSNPPHVFYQAAAGSGEPHAVLSVPPASACPTFGSCGCACGCACLNPWAARGGVPGRHLHPRCGTPGAAQQRQWELLEGGGARVGADSYAPGGLAWLRRPDTPAVDAVEELVGRAGQRTHTWWAWAGAFQPRVGAAALCPGFPSVAPGCSTACLPLHFPQVCIRRLYSFVDDSQDSLQARWSGRGCTWPPTGSLVPHTSLCLGQQASGTCSQAWAGRSAPWYFD